METVKPITFTFRLPNTDINYILEGKGSRWEITRTRSENIDDIIMSSSSCPYSPTISYDHLYDALLFVTNGSLNLSSRIYCNILKQLDSFQNKKVFQEYQKEQKSSYHIEDLFRIRQLGPGAFILEEVFPKRTLIITDPPMPKLDPDYTIVGNKTYILARECLSLQHAIKELNQILTKYFYSNNKIDTINKELQESLSKAMPCKPITIDMLTSDRYLCIEIEQDLPKTL